MQFGPTIRMPYLFAARTMRASRSTPSGPVSRKPAVMTTTAFTPFLPHCSIVAGTSFFVVEYEGPGQVTLTHGKTGRIVPLELDGEREVNVASRAFLCCEDSVEVDVATPRDGAAMLWAQLPLFMLRFSGKGKAFAFARGDLKEVHLGKGERLDVAPGRIVYLDRGRGTWRLRWRSPDGVRESRTVACDDAGEWREKTFPLAELSAGAAPLAFDLALAHESGDDTLFHLVEVRRH